MNNRKLVLDFKKQGTADQNVQMFDPAHSQDYQDDANEMGSDE